MRQMSLAVDAQFLISRTLGVEKRGKGEKPAATRGYGFLTDFSSQSREKRCGFWMVVKGRGVKLHVGNRRTGKRRDGGVPMTGSRLFVKKT